MDPVKLAQALVSLDSVTSASNADISRFMHQQLEGLGFEVDTLPYADSQGTPKLCLSAKRSPKSAGAPAVAENGSDHESAGIGFFCHNDVVSVDGWNCSFGGPLSGTIVDDKLWGRGACDMKGPTAAALAAISRLNPSDQTQPLYFFVTGDEECGMLGARLIVDQSKHFAEMVASGAVGIIGEPTGLQVVNSHKGGCHIDVSSTGVAAHSSTAQGVNANWQMIPFLNYLWMLKARMDTEAIYRNNAFDPPTLSLNLVIENRPSAANITVGQTTCRIFFRPMPDTAWENVLAEIIDAAKQSQLDVQVMPPLPPLYTSAHGPFVETALRLLAQSTPRSVSYATDGCCFHGLKNLIVFGPGHIEQAHRPDEWIDVSQLQRGADDYERLFTNYACDSLHRLRATSSETFRK